MKPRLLSVLALLGLVAAACGSVPTATPVEGIDGVEAISVGGNDICAVADGTLYCWGESAYLDADGASIDPVRPTPIDGLSGVTAVSTWGTNTCAVADGTAYCWDFGGLADGPAQTPTPISGLARVIDVAVGSGHACALTDNGAVHCWGSNTTGQLGDGTTIDRDIPGQLDGLSGVTAIAVSFNGSCAVADGAAYCWGASVS